MKASDFISEAFTGSEKGEVVQATNKMFVTRATIGNRLITVKAYATARPNSYDPDDTSSTVVWDIEFVEGEEERLDKTGSGSEMQVFSFVINTIKELVSRYKPEVMEFSSAKADKNRTGLYSRMLRKIVLPGYHSGPGDSTDEHDTFRIVRDDTK